MSIGSPSAGTTASAAMLLATFLLAGATPAALAAPDSNPAASQPAAAPAAPAADDKLSVTIYGAETPDPSAMSEGPQLDGVITARKGDRIEVTLTDGSTRLVSVGEATRIRGTGGFLGLGRSSLATDSLLSGVPVSVKTLQDQDHLLASEIRLKNRDLKTATMIHNATDLRFTEQGTAIAANSASIAEQAAATEALRGRFGDLDQYNVKSTLSVNFDSGKAVLSDRAKNNLCTTASAADETNNALLLVVGYTDSTGSKELNQALSEKRAGRVVNYLQQKCGWKPWRMLTPTGMATSDPLASNATREGRAQNRRVTVSVLVSKGLDGL